jgi:outer membrane protein assembly factor BamE (lipoprotein component of BamABCDE complex)
MALEFIVEGMYGSRTWDYIGSEDTREEAQQLCRDYDENEPQYPHRVRRAAPKNEDAPVTYKIVRHYQSDEHDNETITRGLTLEEAQAHCQDPEHSSSTATGVEALMVTDTYGTWFDGYTHE